MKKIVTSEMSSNPKVKQKIKYEIVFSKKSQIIKKQKKKLNQSYRYTKRKFHITS